MIACPSCGEENPDRARFCLACGTAIASEPRRKERKYATALFADLVGSTTLAEREDPEVVQAVVGRAFDRLAEEIQRHEGLLEKFMGDAVLAVFGVPRAHEDDPERAVRAALEMQAILSELNRSFAAEGKPQLAMRIGVEAGEVLVDQERASGPRDRMLTGDAVNTAARLQTAADPGRVVVGPGVYGATKEVVEYRDMHSLDLKGKAESVPAWEALRIKARVRGERPHLGMEAKLVGRDEELAVLTQTLRRVQTEGRPALVTIVGPAGVGKSRLVRELERYVEALPDFIYWRRGRCLAYGNISYSALADAIKAQCEILDDDPAEVAGGKADAAVRELFGDDAVAPHVRALVGAGEPESANREELFEAWRRFLERMAARYALVLAFEDLHWADAGLLDFVEHVADWAQGPIMIVALARPELFDARPTWGGGKRNAASLYLDPLSAAEGEAMLQDLVPGDLPELRATIVERSEGNPLYVEEIVRVLIGDGVLRATEGSEWELARPVEDVELPRSIQGLIAARLDGLPEDEKVVLQDAAVVGRGFWTGAVARLSGRDAVDVREALGRLRVKELVVPHEPSSFSDEQEFAFRHLLIRDGAYDSLPKALRAEKHAEVARWAEERAGDRAEEIAELIATHYLEAVRYQDELGGGERGDLEHTAYRWARAAGDRANALWLRAEAVRWYREALRLAESAEVSTADRAAVAKAHTRAAWGTVSTEETERAGREALALFEAAGDELGAGWALSQLIHSQFQQGKDEEAQRAGEDAVARLQPLGETAELAEALHWLGWYHWRRGHTDETELPLRRSIAMATRVDAALVRAAATQTLAVHLFQIGRTEEGLVMIEEAYRLAKEIGESSNLLRIYNNFPSTLGDYASDYRRGSEVAQEGLEVSRKSGSIGNTGWILGTLGDLTAVLGDLPTAEDIQREAIDVATAAGDEPLLGMRWQSFAWVLTQRGRLDEADESLETAIDLMREIPEVQYELWACSTKAILAELRGREEEAIQELRRGVALARAYNVDQTPQIFLELVRLLVRAGEREAAGKYTDLTERARAPFARACAIAVEGLLAEDSDEAMRLLQDAVDKMDTLGARVELSRALLDLGRAARRAGRDPRATFERARGMLIECDARAFLPEAEAELARVL